MRIMGIDPSLRATGWIVVDAERMEALSWGVIRTRGDLKSSLLKIRGEVSNILESYEPQKAAMEAIIYHRNPQIAITLGAVRGIILLTLHDHKVETVEVQPSKMKMGSTGYGKASKQQVANILRNIFSLPEVEDHITDALAAAYYLIK